MKPAVSAACSVACRNERVGGIMSKRTAALLTLTILAACQAAAPQQAPVPSSAWAEEKWSTGCQDDQRDPYGKLIEREKCWAMVSYHQTTDFGLPIGVATIFEIDHRGPRLTQNSEFDADICDEKPIRVAVDGRRIDQLPMQQRIEAVLAGQRLVREADREWPHCNVYDETTTVSGARQAYDEMTRLWVARK
ncbi:hypothetical protein J2Z31_002799 [Sinorhizobium kostiense]|uniref:Lipoprotein n=2 Tax=Sinorhizobium/Ensifer group TaxID=227292 RepID=A0ABS4R072_9HYPH|nr:MULTISPECIES: hypothetical protein [Sinorhizobium]MBP2236285.1 hypothetical protein [Sinorhizobium kostiense]